MGGDALMNNKGSKQTANILEGMKFPLDRPWKYYPQFVMYHSYKGTSYQVLVTMKEGLCVLYSVSYKN